MGYCGPERGYQSCTCSHMIEYNRYSAATCVIDIELVRRTQHFTTNIPIKKLTATQYIWSSTPFTLLLHPHASWDIYNNSNTYIYRSHPSNNSKKGVYGVIIPTNYRQYSGLQVRETRKTHYTIQNTAGQTNSGVYTILRQPSVDWESLRTILQSNVLIYQNVTQHYATCINWECV